MAGVSADTSLGDALDVLTVLMLEVPEQHLRKWRQAMDRARVATQARSGTFDRSTWGLQPDQIEQQRLAMQHLGKGG